MKNNIKTVCMALGIALMAFFSFFVWYRYETSYKITFIGREESEDNRTAVIFQMRGEPMKLPTDMSPYPDLTKGRVIVERDDEKIKTEDFAIFNWGEPLSEDNWEVCFYPAGVEIILKSYGTDSLTAMEEKDSVIAYYDGTDEFGGYSEEEIISGIAARYGDGASFLEKEGDKYCFQADGFVFSVENDFRMTDNYEESYFGYLAQQFSYEHNRIVEFEKSEGEGGEDAYIPVVGFHGRQPREVEAFSNACCDLVEELQEIVGFRKIGYFSEENRRYFEIASYLDHYDRTVFYNAVYHNMEQDSLEEWQYLEQAEDSAEISGDGLFAEVLEEMPAEWRDLEAECSYRKKDGTELRMVGVDRAAGSSYYVLLEAEDGVNTSVLNADPYLGRGGYARWIDFLEDEKIGFSCLAYSGGSLGSLFRTEDGGKSFQEITYPSAEIKLPDGSLYNPFIMPDKIWEEGGKLYMMAGQGPDGDYYEDGIWAYGLYESEDMGKNWSYTGIVEGEDYR